MSRRSSSSWFQLGTGSSSLGWSSTRNRSRTARRSAGRALAAGLGSGDLTDAAALGPAYRNAMMLCAALLLAGAAIAFAAIRAPGVTESLATGTGPGPSPVRFHCAVAGPPLHPSRVAGAGTRLG